MLQGLQQKGKMETLDTQDLTLLLTYQHVKSRGMKQLEKQILQSLERDRGLKKQLISQ